MGGFAEAGSWTRKGEVAKEETLLRSDRQLRMSAEEKDVEMRGFKPCCTSAVACSTSGALQCGCIYPEAGAATPDAYACWNTFRCAQPRPHMQDACPAVHLSA